MRRPASVCAASACCWSTTTPSTARWSACSLQPQGCAITEAVNGKEALDRLGREPFDIVLLDVHMPVMDGMQAIGAIRASAEPWSTLPVIALTADAMSGDRERYLAMGMDRLRLEADRQA